MLEKKNNCTVVYSQQTRIYRHFGQRYLYFNKIGDFEWLCIVRGFFTPLSLPAPISITALYGFL